MSNTGIVRRVRRWIVDQVSGTIFGTVWAWVAGIAMTFIGILWGWVDDLPGSILFTIGIVVVVSALACVALALEIHQRWRKLHPPQDDLETKLQAEHEAEIRQLEMDEAVIRRNAAYAKHAAADEELRQARRRTWG
jgi:hypothetical protein